MADFERVEHIPPGEDQNTFVNVYVNWYVCNGRKSRRSTTATRTGPRKRSARELHPDRDIVQLRIDTLAAARW